MRYSITIYRNGKAKVTVYDTLEAANAAARKVYQETGVILGIEAT